jgi:hypothetical protein
MPPIPPPSISRFSNRKLEGAKAALDEHRHWSLAIGQMPAQQVGRRQQKEVAAGRRNTHPAATGEAAL